MKNLFYFGFVFILSLVTLSSCGSYKQVPYIQDISVVNSESKGELHEARIMPKDLLTITIHTSEPELAAPFNMTVPIAAATNSTNIYSQPMLQRYMVDNSGNIEFPVLGTLYVGGMIKEEVESLIQDRLKNYLKERPIVNVRLVNYKISVLGEVALPGVFWVENERINIFEALALAKDMTIYGLRTNVKVIREDATGKQQVIELDLTDASIVNSPYYFLQQNDIVYVTPNKTRARNADVGTITTVAISTLSILISTASLILNILK